MRNRVILLFVLLVFIPLLSIGQSYNPLRIEFSSKEFNQLYVIPAAPNRVIAFKHFAKRNSKGDQWQVSALDDNLKVVWTKDILVPRSYQLSEYEITNDSILHLLVVKGAGESGSFLKIRLNILNGSYTSYLFKGDRRSLLVGLKMFEGELYLYGLGLEYMQNQLDKYNKQTKYEKIITTKIPPEYYILSALADTARNRFVIVVKNIKSANGELRLLEFDKNGEITKMNLLKASFNQNIINGRLVYSEDSELLFIGTYNNSVRSKKRHRDEENASGVFIGKITSSRFDFFQYYKFTDFNNVLKTLSYREQQRLKNFTAKGKKVDLSFKLLMHSKILKQNGEYIMVAESYFPVYHYETIYDARGYMYQTEVFDGYRTLFAIAASFDAEGKLLWDNYIEVKGVQNYNLTETVTVYNDEDTQVFMYYLNEKIYSKVTKGNEVVFKKEATELPTVKDNEQVLSEDFGRIQHWYGPYFLISGYQKILNRGSKSRKVFFITGVSFE